MKNRFTPLFMALATIVGILIGLFYASHFSQGKLSVVNYGSDKVNGLLQLIDEQYVDSVNIGDLIEEAMPAILAKLDPHSMYIAAADLEDESQQLRGNFGGIGVQFSMPNDTVNVMALVHGGPSERVGILPGDRIIKADTTNLVGKEDVEVMKNLKGEIGTKVTLTIVRRGNDKPLTFEVVRDIIPINSVEASYMMPDNIGYIRIKNFGEQTYNEMLTALADLDSKGMEGLVIDLRGNGGGYMEVAVLMINEFMPRNSLIVYTEGRKSPRKNYYSDGSGSFQHLPLVVLTDEASASASEIFAGAIQDNDRGMVIGRRTFGKGLVQQPVDFSDGSCVRLTVARYYTPSGRCIQKPYEAGHTEDYYNELLERYERGEFFSQDSISFDGPTYETTIGRTVYGGGGIMPDIFIPEDTADVTSYYKEAIYTGLIRQFTFDYADKNREQLAKFATTDKLAAFLRTQNLLEKFARFGEQHGLKRRNLLMQKSSKLFERNIYGSIIFNSRDMVEYCEYFNQEDPVVQRAHQILLTDEWKPVLKEEEENEPND